MNYFSFLSAVSVATAATAFSALADNRTGIAGGVVVQTIGVAGDPDNAAAPLPEEAGASLNVWEGSAPGGGEPPRITPVREPKSLSGIGRVHASMVEPPSGGAPEPAVATLAMAAIGAAMFRRWR